MNFTAAEESFSRPGGILPVATWPVVSREALSGLDVSDSDASGSAFWGSGTSCSSDLVSRASVASERTSIPAVSSGCWDVRSITSISSPVFVSASARAVAENLS